MRLLHVLLQAAHPCLPASLRLHIIKRHPPGQAQKEYCGVQLATAVVMIARRPCRSFIHQAPVPTTCPYFHVLWLSSRLLSKPIPALTLHNSQLLRNYSFRRSDQLLQAPPRTRPWHSNSKGKPSDSKHEKVEHPDGLTTMVQDSRTPSGPR